MQCMKDFDESLVLEEVKSRLIAKGRLRVDLPILVRVDCTRRQRVGFENHQYDEQNELEGLCADIEQNARGAVESDEHLQT